MASSHLPVVPELVRSAEGLWSRSAPWRWMCTCTVLGTATVALLGPWNAPAPTITPIATYQRPAVMPPTGKPGLPGSRGQIGTVGVLGQMAAQPATSPQRVPDGFYDPVFDAHITPPQNLPLPPGTELHVVGVYEGAPPPGVQKVPWHAKCRDISNEAAAIDCHRKFAGQRDVWTVTVTVAASSVPMVLVLSAYEPVKWRIVGATSANLQRIILGGYHGQDIEGAPARVPVDVYSHETSPCQTCMRKSGYFYASGSDDSSYANAIAKIKSITGLEPATVQSTYASDRFYIRSVNAAGSNTHAGAADTAQDTIVDREFVDVVTVGGRNVPLPEGSWRGLVDIDLSSNTGADHLAVLALLEGKVLVGLVAARAQTADDDKGFPIYVPCTRKDLQVVEVAANAAGGSQSCHWLTHVTDPWVQPLFGHVASRLQGTGTALPPVLVAAGFRKADASAALTVAYLVNPANAGIDTTTSRWHTSLWHRKNVGKFPAAARFLDERASWAETWFQIFNAMAP